ncbi:unnamed protein product [Didymodactylos carnosus]|uniref:FAD-dependent oxidoreductase domain-containing protein 1 n=1 Tax=Didymodactylos carnosus TaxID=1234261 RepID=A0A8S2FH28_9BILA|nr:unnamed protein product [Didymodactylos carnosus]CAF4259483.1 unnamed protein product [Didymodactylos carnosus]
MSRKFYSIFSQVCKETSLLKQTNSYTRHIVRWASDNLSSDETSKDLSQTRTSKDLPQTTTSSSTPSTEVSKKSFSLINPSNAHTIKRIDDVPENGTIDYIRNRLTIKSKLVVINSRNLKFGYCFEGLNIPIQTDVLIIGGSVIGSSIAYFIKERAPDLSVTVAERDWQYTTASTVLSAGGMRQQFCLEENIQMSVYGAEFLKHIRKHLSILDDNNPPVIDFYHNGYLILASEKGAPLFEENYKTQTSLGAKVKLLSSNLLKQQFPWLNTDELSWLLAAEDNQIYSMDAAMIVNAAGPWAGEVSKLANIGVGKGDFSVALPVEPSYN